MPIENFLAFVLASVLVLISPGPTVFYVLNRILANGRAHGTAAVVGVMAGDTLAVAASLLGLGALLTISAAAFEVFRWFAAGYIIYLGLQAVFRPRVTRNGVAATNGSGDIRQTCKSAFIVTALNPKSILFFTAFLPLFLSAEAPPVPQLVLMSITFVVLAGINIFLYVVATDALRTFVKSDRALKTLQRIGGGFLVAAGAVLLTQSVKRG